MVTPPWEEQESDDHETHDQHYGAPDAELSKSHAVTNVRRSPEEPELCSLQHEKACLMRHSGYAPFGP
jgi:hypothetical protein